MTEDSGDQTGKIFPANVKYSQLLLGPQLRPNARMPIEAHRECGRLLTQVAHATARRRGASEQVNFVRYQLEDWAMQEYCPIVLDDEILADLYRSGSRVVSGGYLDRPALICDLIAVQHVLRQHYPTCEALRKILKHLDRAITSIEKWDGTARGRAYH